MGRLLLLTIVLIVYGSLYPWHLHALPPGQNALSILLHSWPNDPAPLLVRDVAVNILVYVPLGLVAFATFNSIWPSLLLGALLSTFLELSQAFIVARVSSLLDVESNTLGTALGIAAGLLWTRTGHRAKQPPDSTLLLACWIVYQCFPFLPRLRPILVKQSPPQDVFLYFAEALALILLLQKDLRLAVALLLAVPLKAFIDTRTLSIAEIICYVAALGIASFLPVSPSVAAVALAAALAFHGLAPYHFLSRPHEFNWVPFQASLSLEWEPALTIILGKIFPYGALLWLIRESGVRLLYATLLTAALLASIETVQMYLPGRSSEIIDPLIAIILGWVFYELRRTARSSKSQ